MHMKTLRRSGTLALCIFLALEALFSAPQRPAASEVTVSFGQFAFSWPTNTGALYLGFQWFAGGVCFSLNVIRLVGYSTCRHCLSAALEEAVHTAAIFEDVNSARGDPSNHGK
jgi:hypothetical protein